MKYFYCLLLPLVFSSQVLCNTWKVGAAQVYTKPSQVANLVQNGDTVLIEAGIYPNDVARWSSHNLLIRGIGGMAHLKCGGNVYGGKAIWVVAGNDVTIENIEFSEAKCPDRNGAGIRSEGINLTLRHCYFHHNEDGILAGDIASGDFLIEHCEFNSNGYPDGLAHNLYINHAHSLTFRYNYSHDALVGHELKSRAYTNYIYCNRFSDENGSASRSIDLPNGGLCVLVGNVIVQDQYSENNNIIGFGLEGVSNPSSALYLAYNTIVNNKNVGSFVQIANGTPLLKAYNNIFAGPGTLIAGNAVLLDTMHNLAGPVAAFGFVEPAAYDFNIASNSIAALGAIDAGSAGVIALSLTPTASYSHPANFKPRVHAVDIGAFAIAQSSTSTSPVPPTVKLYPNPVQDVLNLYCPEIVSYWELSDFTGKKMLTGTYFGQINVRQLPPGIYLLQLQFAGNRLTLPVLKQ